MINPWSTEVKGWGVDADAIARRVQLKTWFGPLWGDDLSAGQINEAKEANRQLLPSLTSLDKYPHNQPFDDFWRDMTAIMRQPAPGKGFFLCFIASLATLSNVENRGKDYTDPIPLYLREQLSGKMGEPYTIDLIVDTLKSQRKLTEHRIQTENDLAKFTKGKYSDDSYIAQVKCTFPSLGTVEPFGHYISVLPYPSAMYSHGAGPSPLVTIGGLLNPYTEETSPYATVDREELHQYLLSGLKSNKHSAHDIVNDGGNDDGISIFEFCDLGHELSRRLKDDYSIFYHKAIGPDAIFLNHTDFGFPVFHYSPEDIRQIRQDILQEANLD